MIYCILVSIFFVQASNYSDAAGLVPGENYTDISIAAAEALELNSGSGITFGKYGILTTSYLKMQEMSNITFGGSLTITAERASISGLLQHQVMGIPKPVNHLEINSTYLSVEGGANILVLLTLFNSIV